MFFSLHFYGLKWMLWPYYFFSISNVINEVKRRCEHHCFLLWWARWVICLYGKIKFGAQRDHIELHKMHRNMSVGQVWGETEIHKLSFLFGSLFILNGYQDWCCQDKFWRNFVVHLWRLKTKNFRFINFSVSHKGRVCYIAENLTTQYLKIPALI